MATTARRRLLKDIQKMEEEVDEGIHAEPDPDNLYEWDAVIYGP